MRRDFRPILWALALILPMAVPAAAQQQPPQRTLTVTGTGSATAAPDIAYVDLGIVERRDTAAEALEAMSLAAGDVFARLAAAGIAAENIQTSKLSLAPFYGSSGLNSTARIMGFEASTRLNVRIEDLSRAGDVLDAVVQNGANQLGGIQFSIADPAPYLDIARRDAVMQARAKAELFAEAAGVTLGPLMTFADQGGSGPEPLMMMEMADVSGSRSVPVAQGEVNVTAGVYLVYAIE